MTREQQINKASIANSDSISEALSFARGARWADEHPVDVWHDASVRPKDNYEILVQWNIKGNSGYESYYTCSIENWDRFVERHGVFHWAYVNDLLQKGGLK